MKQAKRVVEPVVWDVTNMSEEKKAEQSERGEKRVEQSKK